MRDPEMEGDVYSTLTALDLVRLVAFQHGVIDLDDDVCDHILWERTAFPVAGIDYVHRQLHELFAEGNTPE